MLSMGSKFFKLLPARDFIHWLLHVHLNHPVERFQALTLVLNVAIVIHNII